jgi:site-specific recombinase XerD
VDEFASDLQQQRYSMATIRKSVLAIDRFVQWLQNHNLGLEDAHEKNAERYRDTLDRYASGRPPTAARGLKHGIAFLRRKGIVKHQAPSAPLTPAERWLLRFDAYLERVGGAADSTRKQYHTILARFLDARFGISEPDWSLLSANDLTSFVQREAAQRRGFGRKVPPVALRAFLRFLLSQGLVRAGLIDGVPSPRQWKHAALPQRATAEQVLPLSHNAAPKHQPDCAIRPCFCFSLAWVSGLRKWSG